MTTKKLLCDYKIQEILQSIKQETLCTSCLKISLKNLIGDKHMDPN